MKRELGLVEAIAIGVGSAVGTGVVKLHGAVGSLMAPSEFLLGFWQVLSWHLYTYVLPSLEQGVP